MRPAPPARTELRRRRRAAGRSELRLPEQTNRQAAPVGPSGRFDRSLPPAQSTLPHRRPQSADDSTEVNQRDPWLGQIRIVSSEVVPLSPKAGASAEGPTIAGARAIRPRGRTVVQSAS